MKKTTNIEISTDTTTTKKSGMLGKALTLALCGALTLGNISCGGPSPKDVMKQEQKMESLKYMLKAYIRARENEANKYNSLLAELATATSTQKKRDIKSSLSGIYETIVEYDEKIQDLSEDISDAEKDLNYYTAEVESAYAPNTPIDPNRWDFLLR